MHPCIPFHFRFLYTFVLWRYTIPCYPLDLFRSAKDRLILGYISIPDSSVVNELRYLRDARGFLMKSIRTGRCFIEFREYLPNSISTEVERFRVAPWLCFGAWKIDILDRIKPPMPEPSSRNSKGHRSRAHRTEEMHTISERWAANDGLGYQEAAATDDVPNHFDPVAQCALTQAQLGAITN